MLSRASRSLMVSIAAPLRLAVAPLGTSCSSSSRWQQHQRRLASSKPERTDDEYVVPTLDIARTQPRRFRELSNETLFSMAVAGDYNARKERFIREIMRVDNLDWAAAKLKIDTTINTENDQFAWLVTLPYRIGVSGGLVAAVSSVPLVFHRPTAAWFNEQFVHEDLPEDGLESLDTIWKVGNWTWGWMEPYLGTASFVLLGLQFARIHMQRLHLKPYTERVLSWRAGRLVRKFPQYDARIVSDFSKADPWHA